MTTRTSSGEIYARLVYERLQMRSDLEEVESGNAAPRAAHETALKRIMILRLEKSMAYSEHGGNEGQRWQRPALWTDSDGAVCV